MWNYYDYGYKPRKKPKDPAAQLAKLRKKNPDIKPVILEGKKLARTWWGMAWNKNLESYADYESRIVRGRSYVRSGAVLDLSVGSGGAHALVSGSASKPYEITVKIEPLPKKKWDALMKKCSHKIASLEDLASGKFPEELMELFMDKGGGLFPSPKEISFSCSCPDWAYMCKHVAAALYGIGARFDDDPMLFFTLRDIDFTELLKKTVEEKMKSMLKNAGKATGRVIKDVDTHELFGV
ncbi:MAG: hypothetical protein FWG42_04295 [Clostridiales bacterium]|nr:hypothetical protein [Clostridiales bacterium]